MLYLTGFAPYLTLSHVTDGPEVKNLRRDRVEVCFYQNETLTARSDRQYYAYIIQVCVQLGQNLKWSKHADGANLYVQSNFRAEAIDHYFISLIFNMQSVVLAQKVFCHNDVMLYMRSMPKWPKRRTDKTST